MRSISMWQSFPPLRQPVNRPAIQERADRFSNQTRIAPFGSDLPPLKLPKKCKGLRTHASRSPPGVRDRGRSCEPAPGEPDDQRGDADDAGGDGEVEHQECG